MIIMTYKRVLASTYDDFERHMTEQSFAFVQLSPIGSDEPSMAPGQYGLGAIGKIQFESHTVAWIERFVQKVMIPGCRVVQRLDPYFLHDGKQVPGMLALYVPRKKASALRINDIQVAPPSFDPSCGIVFVTRRGFPVDRGDGWCISFDLAINDYELDCVTRLQCLLQGLCPRVSDQLENARNCLRLDPEKAKCFEIVLARTSATRHPKSLSLSEAISLVAFCARRKSKKRVRLNVSFDLDAKSPGSLSPPPTPTGITPKRQKTNPLTALINVPSPEQVHAQIDSLPAIETAAVPEESLAGPQLPHGSPPLPDERDISNSSASPQPATTNSDDHVQSPESVQTRDERHMSVPSSDSVTKPNVAGSGPIATATSLHEPSVQILECSSNVQTTTEPSVPSCSLAPTRLYSPFTPSPTTPASPDLSWYEQCEPPEGDNHEDEVFEIDHCQRYLDDGIHTPMPLGVSMNCPPEIDTRYQLLSPPTVTEEEEKEKESPEPPIIAVNRAISKRYSSKRWYEYAYSVDFALAYNKFQETIDDDHPVKIAYAFPHVDAATMASLYPCVVTLVKLEKWSQETFEVFGAATLRQAIELVLFLHTKITKKCPDVYVAMSGDGQCTNIPVDVPLDNGVPIEEVILKRCPKDVVKSTRMNPIDGDQGVCAWLPGGAVHLTPGCLQKRHTTNMSGLGIPKRQKGHQPPVCCQTDENSYRMLYAQPKTLQIPRDVQQLVRKLVPLLKSFAFNRHQKESDYFPSSITSSGDWLAEHHHEIASAALHFIRNRGRSECDAFPLQCKLWSQRCLEMQRGTDGQIALRDFLIYYLELIELFSRSGTIIGDAIYFQRQHKRTADFILDVVFARAESLARLFKEKDNKDECLWVSRTRL